jgi:hypothetical protein
MRHSARPSRRRSRCWTTSSPISPRWTTTTASSWARRSRRTGTRFGRDRLPVLAAGLRETAERANAELATAPWLSDLHDGTSRTSKPCTSFCAATHGLGVISRGRELLGWREHVSRSLELRRCAQRAWFRAERVQLLHHQLVGELRRLRERGSGVRGEVRGGHQPEREWFERRVAQPRRAQARFVAPDRRWWCGDVVVGEDARGVRRPVRCRTDRAGGAVQSRPGRPADQRAPDGLALRGEHARYAWRATCAGRAAGGGTRRTWCAAFLAGTAIHTGGSRRCGAGAGCGRAAVRRDAGFAPRRARLCVGLPICSGNQMWWRCCGTP